MGLEVMVFLRACSRALCQTNDMLFLGKSRETGRTMTSNTNRLINGKLHHQTRLQPSLRTRIPIYGSAPLDVLWTLRLNTPKIVTFCPPVTTPTVFLINVSSTSQPYILPEVFVKIVIRKVRGVAQDCVFLTNPQSMLLLMEDHLSVARLSVVHCLPSKVPWFKPSECSWHLKFPCSSGSMHPLVCLPHLPKWPY